jgi:hypothetical protein
MAVFTGKTYKGTTIDLDRDSYRNCIFIDCTLVYRGKTPVRATIQATGCTWELTDAALRTFNFLHANPIPFCDNCKDK